MPTTPPTRPELRPCLNCGLAAEIVHTQTEPGVHWTRVFCPRCQIGSGDWESQVAFDRWNDWMRSEETES